MPRRVVGADAFERGKLRAAKVAALRRALAAVEAAKGTPRLVPREWTDDDLEKAAAVLAADIEAFASYQVLDTSRRFRGVPGGAASRPRSVS